MSRLKPGSKLVFDNKFPVMMGARSLVVRGDKEGRLFVSSPTGPVALDMHLSADGETLIGAQLVF